MVPTVYTNKHMSVKYIYVAKCVITLPTYVKIHVS